MLDLLLYEAFGKKDTWFVRKSASIHTRRIGHRGIGSADLGRQTNQSKERRLRVHYAEGVLYQGEVAKSHNSLTRLDIL